VSARAVCPPNLGPSSEHDNTMRSRLATPRRYICNLCEHILEKFKKNYESFNKKEIGFKFDCDSISLQDANLGNSSRTWRGGGGGIYEWQNSKIQCSFLTFNNEDVVKITQFCVYFLFYSLKNPV
jgi:hypothetical protein